MCIQELDQMIVYTNNVKRQPIQDFLTKDVDVRTFQFKDANELCIGDKVIRGNGKIASVVLNGNGGQKFTSVNVSNYLTQEIVNLTKICSQCQSIKSTVHFVSGIKVNGSLTKRCGHCRDHNIKSSSNDCFRTWVTNKKMNDIRTKGCISGNDCPLRKDIEYKSEWFEYNHLVQETKVYPLSRWNWWSCPKHYSAELGFSSAKEAWLAEHDKCDLMCTMCHSTFTKRQRKNKRKRSRQTSSP